MSTDHPLQSEPHQDNQPNRTATSERVRSYPDSIARVHGHKPVGINEWLPEKALTPYDIDLTDSSEYGTRFRRCRKCGQGRDRRNEFSTRCEESQPPSALEAGRHLIEEPRTRRALTEETDVRFGQRGPVYDVFSESESTYVVDVEKETCTCPDFEQRQLNDGCKHLRRVDLEIWTGITLAPDGVFNR